MERRRQVSLRWGVCLALVSGVLGRYNLNGIEERVHRLLNTEEVWSFEHDYDTLLKATGRVVDPAVITEGFRFQDWEAFVRDGDSEAPAPAEFTVPFWKACDADLNGLCSFGEYVRARGHFDAYGREFEQSEWDERESALDEEAPEEEEIAPPTPPDEHAPNQAAGVDEL